MSPYFIVSGAQKWMDFLKDLFNAEELRRFDGPDGTIMHAEVRIDDSVIMLSDATDKFPPVELVMHVYVQNVDAVYARAIGLGCTPVEAPKTREGDPDKRGSFKDAAGNWWSVSSQQP